MLNQDLYKNEQGLDDNSRYMRLQKSQNICQKQHITR